MRKPASFYFFKRKPIVQKDRYELWRGVANLLGFTTQERLRVEWMVFYYTAGKENAALTAQHFGISLKYPVFSVIMTTRLILAAKNKNFIARDGG
jgi:hypothetical protein